MSFSDFLELEILDHVFGGAVYTPPATLYLALFTTAPNTETGAGGVEVSGGSYARAAVTNNSTNFPAASGGSKTTGVNIDFPTPSAGWGQVVAAGIYDAATGGNLLGSNALTTPKTINSGDPVSFPAGAITITLN